jgi:hypothetical protein
MYQDRLRTNIGQLDGKDVFCRALEKTGCPVITTARGAVSGAKVAGQQRCGKATHGFFPPRLDWSQAVTLPKVSSTSQVCQCLRLRLRLCLCLCLCLRLCLRLRLCLCLCLRMCVRPALL